ncbi:MAG: DUF1501 domain-containing protein [Verrucomicrobiae bacterium]|nr:DUF1501 domain-containing protein [Verrucomicrobiae bacterium]
MFDLVSSPLGWSGAKSRRAFLRVGALGSMGLSLPDLLKAERLNGAPQAGGRFGRAKRCLFLFMWGGPSHLDTFDLKPDAPSEFRGTFLPRRTSAPEIRMCEHFPHLAQQAHQIGLIRSVTHADNNHSTSAHWMLTGHKHALAAENFGARRSDFPHIGSVVSHVSPPSNGLPGFVSLPKRIGTTAGFVTPGQNGGFLGGAVDPFQISQAPTETPFRVRDLHPVQGVNPERTNGRLDLLTEFDQFRGTAERWPETLDFDEFQHRALEMVTAPAVRDAFDLDAEGPAERERYGMRPFGQSVLLARRLLESGVKLVTVYWAREDSDGARDTTWDTHSDNFSQLRDRLIPQVDAPVAFVLKDLAERGMLDDTLVVWSSEFGRSPRINPRAGRDHWGRCNTVWMAGAGIPGGQAYGVSDKIGSEPVSDPVAPADISATIFHLLGIDPRQTITDRLNRSFPISDGKVLTRFLGA